MLPAFTVTAQASESIATERRTSRAIRLLWDYASKTDQEHAEFLLLLMRCTWVNSSDGPGDASRRRRNVSLAHWYEVDADLDEPDLAEALTNKSGIPLAKTRWLVTSDFGFTHYYKAFRGFLEDQVKKKRIGICGAFRFVARSDDDPLAKVEAVSKLVVNLGEFDVATGTTSFLNALTPVLACLDPQHLFPVVNARTKPLLRAIGHSADVAGIVALSALIDGDDIADAFHLDVYSQAARDEFKPIHRTTAHSTETAKTIGLKSEEESIAIYGAREVTIRKRHNELMNKLTAALKSPPYIIDDDVFDAVIYNYDGDRHLLIEAKSETEGVLGRTQMRQAIGQLFDYRWREFPADRDKVDLALLTLKKPPQDMLDLLKDLRIEALWFTNDQLVGTISL